MKKTDDKQFTRNVARLINRLFFLFIMFLFVVKLINSVCRKLVDITLTNT